MAFNKTAIMSHKCSVRALNKPTGEGWDVYDLPDQIKTASKDADSGDLGGFDIKTAVKEHPDHLYVKIFAIKKDEPNDNGDAFSEEELKKGAESFIGVPLFTNHQNDDIEKARGECIHSWYDDKEGGIFIIGKVDKVAYPRLARGIEQGYVNGTSMGCSVSYSLCSICHNLAHTANEYCSHVKNGKNRKFSGKVKCAYHKSDSTELEEKCPICGSTKRESQSLDHDNQPVFEHNFGLKFIENSFVVNPACHDCGVKCILHAPTVQKKIASLSNLVDKMVKESYVDENSPAIQKIGGIKELNSLKDSMSEMENVVKSMLKQKENVSMEYVSDLVKAMADVQSIFDELVEMGYGALPSPEILGDSEVPISTAQFPAPVPPQNLQPQPSAQHGEGGSVETTDLGGLGKVTMPKKSSKNKEDFGELNQSLIDKISYLNQNINNLNKNINSQLEIGVKMAIENKTTKVAAGSDNLDIITEKQLAKKEESLHPRTDEVYEGITESKEQLGGKEKSNDTTSESPQVRKGTYETITEDQLKSKSALGEAVIHFNEYPDVITEKQWNDFSRTVAGDLPDDYTEQITQAQIRDLLSKHKFIGNVETITEDQLRNISMTDGLKRWANKSYSTMLIKMATQIVSDLIGRYGQSPAEIKRIISMLNDDSDIKSKVSFLSVVNSLPDKKHSRETIANNVSYFSKTSSKNQVSSIDALILSTADNAQFGAKVEDVFDAVHHVINDKTSMDKVNAMVEEKINKMSGHNAITKESAFESAVKELDKPSDGLYRIHATLKDIGVSPKDKKAFVEGIKKFAQMAIDDESVAAAVIKVQVGDDGTLIIDIQDGAENEVGPDDIGDIVEGPVEDIDADINGGDGIVDETEVEEPSEETEDETGGEFGEEKEDCSSAPKAAQPAQKQPITQKTDSKVNQAKTEIKKKAQMMGGEMGGQGGMGQGPGAGASLPQPPAAGTPPMESLTNPDDATDPEGGMGEDTENSEPLPPGSICPVCGSDDVDVVAGKGKCNNCSSEMTYKVEINVSKWEGITPSEEESGGEGDEFSGEGFEMPKEDKGLAPEGGEAGLGGPSTDIPAAASTKNLNVNKFAAVVKIKPEAIKKASSEKIKIGSISPATGKSNTVQISEGNYICLDTGTKYKVSYVVSKDGKQVYGQWEWEPKVSSAICPSCSRAKQKFVKALSTINITESDFNKMELKDQVETISKLKQSGALSVIKTASKEGTVLGDYKLAYGGYGDKFPMESCIEKLSRRFGQNAVCLSGPDEGKPLAESVCNRLKKADVYSNSIAVKVAESWGDCDGDEECITHQVRSGYTLRQASEICSVLKVAVADGEEFLADDMSSEPTTPDVPVEENVGGPVEEDIDPFESGEGDMGSPETVTLELPIDVVKQLDEKLDSALGENPAAEETSDIVPPTDEVSPVDTGAEDPLASTEGPVENIAPNELGEEKPAMPAEGNAPAPEAAAPCTEFKSDSKPAEDCGDIVKEDPAIEDGSLPEEVPGEGTEKKVVIKMDGQEVTASNDVLSKSIGKVGKLDLNLEGVMKAINKSASDKEISQQKAQDSKDIGSYTAGEKGSLMGHESETIKTPQKPSVPRDQATMGQESPDLNPKDKPQPKIPSGDATMGHEKEVGLSGGDDRYTGGNKGQGKIETASVEETEDIDLYHMRGFTSSKKGLSSLADRIAAKLAPKAPVADDADVKPYSGDSKIGKEEEIKAVEVNESTVKSDGGFIGHEKETIGKDGGKPDSPKDHPEVFTGNAQMGKEELNSEKTNKDKGTVIANNDSESEAYRVAARMVQAKKIEPVDLQKKVNELKSYKPEQIMDIEKSIFASEKGLNTASDGKLSQPIQINENSSVRNAKDELSQKLSSLFTLGKQNLLADEDDLTQLRKMYNK